jgi:MFS family permease
MTYADKTSSDTAVNRGGSASRETWVIAAASQVSTACVLPSFLLGAMAVQIRADLAITASGIGLGFAVFFVTASLASAPGGRLADRSDPARVTRQAAVVSGVTSLFIATLASSLPLIVAGLAVAGAANAVCQTAANLIIVRALPVRRQGFALAVKQSAIPGATLLAGLAVPGFALTFGWRWGFAAGAGLAFLTAALIPRGPYPAAHATGGRRPPGSGPDVPLQAMMLLAAAVGLAGTAASSLGSFLVSAAVDANLSEAGGVPGRGAAGILNRLGVARPVQPRSGQGEPVEPCIGDRHYPDRAVHRRRRGPSAVRHRRRTRRFPGRLADRGRHRRPERHRTGLSHDPPSQVMRYGRVASLCS